RHRTTCHMAGDEGDGMVHIAMGDGNTRIAKAAHPGRDAGNDAERNTGINKRQCFFAAATKDEGVASLEAQYAQSLAGKLHQPRGDIALLRTRLATALAGIFKFRTGLCELENGFI